MIRYPTSIFSADSLSVMQAVPTAWTDDLAALLSGRRSAEEITAECQEGAEDDETLDGWSSYVGDLMHAQWNLERMAAAHLAAIAWKAGDPRHSDEALGLGDSIGEWPAGAAPAQWAALFAVAVRAEFEAEAYEVAE